MADRVSASIILGGTLSASDFTELVEIIGNEALSIDWEGEPFAPHQRVIGRPLSLCDHEVAWGRFAELESWCAAHGLPFVRSSGGYGNDWGPERVVSAADGTQVSYATTEGDDAIITREQAEQLGSIEAILDYFDAANVEVPPLVVEGDDLAAVAPTTSYPSPAGAAHVE